MLCAGHRLGRFSGRVSANRQQQTQTIDQQLERLQAHVAAHPDWQLTEAHIYRDDGYSGAKLNRPGLEQPRDQAALAAFELVLITVPDRLARNYAHQMLVLEELRQHPMSDEPQFH
jgi:site-specific DNA recombinase